MVNHILLLLYIIFGLTYLCFFIFYLYIASVLVFREGQISYKTLLANDLDRMQIIKTGEDIPLRLSEEYKWYKGYVFSFMMFIPLILMLLLHTILINTVGAGTNGAGIIASIFYFAIFAFFRLETGANLAIPDTRFYFILLGVPVVVALLGTIYVLGARKTRLQREQVERKHRQIYGDQSI